jgi:hypothetical protein
VRNLVTRLTGLLLGGLTLLLAACDSGGTCGPGEPCDCHGGEECYLSCSGAGCGETCENQIRCGGVCDDQCSFSCHDMNDCTTSCGAACTAMCGNTVSCGAIIGPDSHYTCHDTQRCGVDAGDGSVIDCHNATTCEVVCEGSCHVQCLGTNTCRVFCGGPGKNPIMCNDGSDACGC